LINTTFRAGPKIQTGSIALSNIQATRPFSKGRPNVHKTTIDSANVLGFPVEGYVGIVERNDGMTLEEPLSKYY
jgi:hypothetical protein